MSPITVVINFVFYIYNIYVRNKAHYAHEEMVAVMSSIVCTRPQYMFVLNSFEQCATICY